MKPWQHFKTITHHKLLVLDGCFRVGLYWQGLTHDLSKYSPTEFWVGAKYYQGDRSPNGAEREEKGYSEAWMHHKGRNRHHYEYWTDMSMVTRNYESVAMPRKYLVEMVMDRRAACMTYQGDAYTDGSPFAYFDRSREKSLMHPKTKRELDYILRMHRDRGEEATFRYLRESVLKGKPFPWEIEEKKTSEEGFMAASWLKDAVFYEIYPQTFRDSNGDGIGDIQGIIEKLDYVKSLGCNAIWMNPCFDSPFIDAGYDVRDYKKVAPRYGTNEDLKRLFAAAHEKGIRILLDLVPGHTSQEHAWFLESAKEEPNDLSERYIWTNDAFAGGDGMPFIGGEHPRNGTYIINFFKCQPALNYGYRERRQSWQQGIYDPAPMATREAMKDVMRFWLDMGCDGFRVDMADSLVKNDGGEKIATMEVWRDIAGTIHAEYPEMALVSEWGRPYQALKCGFDMDFYLEWHGNGYSSLMRDYERDGYANVTSENNSFFKATAKRDMSHFLEDYLPQYEASKNDGLWCFITGNHDTARVAPYLDDAERRLAFSFLFTMPGAPFLYYGDEIGMGYRWLPTKEGGYLRTGSRTPMQWNNGKNMGFSEGSAEDLYLPVDPAEDAPNVASQENDPNSFLSFMKGLIALRHSYEDLQNYSPFKVYSAEKGSRLFAYKRGKLLLATNPGLNTEELKLDGKYEVIYTIGEPAVNAEELTLPKQSFAVLAPVE